MCGVNSVVAIVCTNLLLICGDGSARPEVSNWWQRELKIEIVEVHFILGQDRRLETISVHGHDRSH